MKLPNGTTVKVVTKSQKGTSISNSIAKEIDDKTKVISEFAAAIERNSGSDSTNVTWTSGGTWYNEIFDGITVVVKETKIKVGTMQPNISN